MTNRKFYRTTIAIEVLSEEPIPDIMGVDAIVQEATEWGFSMIELPRTGTVLNGLEAAQNLKAQATDPGFFQLTDDGEDE